MNKKGQQLTLGSIISIVLGIAVLVFLIFGFSTGWKNLYCNTIGCEPEFRITVEECRNETIMEFNASFGDIITSVPIDIYDRTPVISICTESNDSNYDASCLLYKDVCEDVEVSFISSFIGNCSIAYKPNLKLVSCPNTEDVVTDKGISIEWLENNCELSKIYDETVTDGKGHYFDRIYKCNDYKVEVTQ